MVNLYVRIRKSLVQTAYLFAFYVLARIALRSQDKAHDALFLPLQLTYTLPVGDGAENVIDVRLQARQNDLGFRIAETAIELYYLDSVLRFHEPAIKYALERAALSHKPSGNRLHNLFQGEIAVLPADERKRSVGSHAAGIRPPVSVEGAFVVLRQHHRIDLFTVHEAEEGEFRAFKIVLNNHLSLAESVVQKHVFKSLIGIGKILRNHYALSSGEPVVFQHDWKSILRAHIFEGLCIVLESPVGSRRNSVLLHDSLGEVLA